MMEAFRTIRADSAHHDFRSLVRSLDEYLAEKDGDDHAFYDQYNQPHNIRHVIIAYQNEEPVACGAIRGISPGVTEVKRMYTKPAFRGRGYAAAVLGELEKWARELGFRKCVLETGLRQTEAVRFYGHNGYRRIPNYGPYAGVENSLCFEKEI